MERFKLIASVYLIIIRNNRVLLLRRQNTGYEDGNYGLPAGHVEDNESITSALSREVKEEIGLDIKPEEATLVHVMHRKEKDIRADFFFTAQNIQGEPKNMESEKCDDLSWFPLNKLPKNIIHYIKIAIQSSQERKIYSEKGW